MIETSVIVVTYNSATDIEECVRSVATAAKTEVIVVDNDSSDSTASVLRELEQRGLIDRLVLSPTNDGFAKAVNKGMRLAQGRDIFLLNPDATIAGADLERLRDIARADPVIGVLAPLVENGPGVATIGAGRQPTLWPLFTHFTGLARAFPHVRFLRGRHLYHSAHARSDETVEWVSGCAMYIREPALRTAGELSEKWFMYGEDIDYAKRVRDAGYEIRVTPLVHAWHAIGSSVNQSTGPVSTLWSENTYDYYVTAFRAGPARRFAWRVLFSAGLVSRAAVLELRSRSMPEEDRAGQRDRARRFRAHAAAVWRKRSRPAR